MKIGHILGVIAIGGMIWMCYNEYQKQKEKRKTIRIIKH